MRGVILCVVLGCVVGIEGTPGVNGVPPSVYTGKRWVEANFSDGEVKPPRPVVSGNPTVHVSISSYRDDLCGRTLFELFNFAKNPKNVKVGVVEQFLEGDTRCVEEYCKMMKEEKNLEECPYTDRVDILALEAGEAQGPMHARSFGGKLIGDEEFCLQIDSHIRAVQDWDSKLIEEWESAENEYAVLSTYVQKIEDMTSRDTGSNINNWREVPMMCSTVSGMYGMVRNNQATAARGLTRPLRSCYWGAGLSFAKCHMEKTVKHDPHSRGVFDGEEFTRAIRMWTNGYDMYVPSRGIIFHDYTKAQKSPKKWHSNAQHSSHEKADPAIAYKRLKGLLGLEGGVVEDMGEYGFGSKRTKQQYEQLCAMDLSRSPRNFEEGKDVCGRLPWVPWNAAESVEQHTVKLAESQHNGNDNEIAKTDPTAVKIVTFADAHRHSNSNPPIVPTPLKTAGFLLLIIVFAASRLPRVRGFCIQRTRTE
eukprot:TRINITY_DN23850_c0_g1_i1.p1 TRINITY_DN23850_c0_g1~~TRINITY_DN23850_c0_g1_i1.p1  ORF type:complete len:492 (+),score=46.05 TRINITY_DN23850_c0_g1_i1:46-1476(+)